MKALPLLSLTILLFFSHVVSAQESNENKGKLSKKEAKKIASDINQSMDEMTKQLNKLDWNAFGDILSKTIEKIDQNAASLNEVIQNIDKRKLEKNLNDLSIKMEESIDLKRLEQQIQKLGQRLQPETSGNKNADE